ncbi:MAG TPA: hypothetical protein PKU86_07620, partial [Bacteroidales bacterium]|nr:hypothetical protein [Bacteroidales bacterium]
VRVSYTSPYKKEVLINQYEKKITFERRQKAETAAMLTAISGIFIFVVHITTKISEWSPMGDYFSFSFRKINLDEGISANDNENS